MSNILDALYGGIMFFVFAVAALVGLFILNALISGGVVPTNLQDGFRGFYTSINNVSIFVMLAMSLGAIVSALLIRTHPAFFIISIVLVFIEFMVIPPLVGAYNGLAATPDFSVSAAALNLNVELMQQLPIWTAFATLAAAVIGIGREI